MRCFAGKAAISAVTAAVVMVLTLPGSAAADVLCVNKTGDHCDQLFAASQIQAAFSAANSNQNSPDRIEIGPGVYPYGPFSAISTVEIVGAGIGETVLTHQNPLTFAQILLLANYDNPLQEISDLTLRVNSADNARALLVSDGVVERVRVEVGDQVVATSGIDAYGATLRDVEVKAPGNGLAIIGGGVLEDSEVEGGSGVIWNTGVIRRTRIKARSTGVSLAGSIRVENSLIEMSGPNSTGISGLNFTGNASINHVTIVGDGSAGSVGLSTHRENSAYFGPVTATASVRNSSISGFATAVRHGGYQGVGGVGCAIPNCPVTQNTSIAWSHVSGTIDDRGGPGKLTLTPGVIRQGAGFVNPTRGDYRLRFDSPLVDAGEPVGLAGSAFYLNESPLTVDGTLRIRPGSRQASARRDIGAFEYQRQAPLARIEAPATAFLYRPVTVRVRASDPDSDPLRYEFDFAGQATGASGAGSAVTRSFSSLGRKQVRVIVTDAAGMADVASATLKVVAKKGRCANKRVGRRGRDIFNGSPAGDKLVGKGGADVLRGGKGADCLDGGVGADVLDGGPGADRIKGGPGADRIKGGLGADWINVRGGGVDTVDCGPGRDRVIADPQDRLRNCEKVS